MNQNYFKGNIVENSTASLEKVSFVHYIAEAKVHNFDITLWIQEQVLRLQVTMHHHVVVIVFHPWHNLFPQHPINIHSSLLRSRILTVSFVKTQQQILDLKTSNGPMRIPMLPTCITNHTQHMLINNKSCVLQPLPNWDRPIKSNSILLYTSQYLHHVTHNLIACITF